jgi:hypothetical protein
VAVGLSAQFPGRQLRQVVGIHRQAPRLATLHVIIIILVPAEESDNGAIRWMPSSRQMQEINPYGAQEGKERLPGCIDGVRQGRKEEG